MESYPQLRNYSLSPGLTLAAILAQSVADYQTWPPSFRKDWRKIHRATKSLFQRHTIRINHGLLTFGDLHPFNANGEFDQERRGRLNDMWSQLCLWRLVLLRDKIKDYCGRLSSIQTHAISLNISRWLSWLRTLIRVDRENNVTNQFVDFMCLMNRGIPLTISTRGAPFFNGIRVELSSSDESSEELNVVI